MSNYCFGVDLGGTTAKIGLFTASGDLLDKWEIPTRNEEEGKYILPDIAESVLNKMAEKNLEKSDVIGIGIGVPGPIDADGYLPHIANLAWESKEVTKELTELTGLPSKGGNDANVAALGEAWKGAAAGCRNVIMLTLGTGVGGGIIVDGKIVIGAHGAGGEVGHAHISDDIPGTCGCGNHGCLEQVASATGIAKLAKAALEESDEPSCIRGIEKVDAKAVFDGLKSGDALCTKVIERFAKYLGDTIAIFTAVLDPEAVVIGGGVSKAGPILLEYVRKYYLMNCFRSTRDTRFEIATLGNDAGMYGCAKLVLEK